MSMRIEGLGVVSTAGNGLGALAGAGRAALGGRGAPRAVLADTEALSGHLPPRALRRTDHFTRMTLLAAYMALEDAGEKTAGPETGIVLATGYGPSRLTFDFLDSLLDFGPDMASPQAFAHSVHNIPAATVAVMMGVTGPCTTICQPDTAVAAAFLTARTWMAEGRVERVLLGAVDERMDLLEDNVRRLAGEIPAGTSGGQRTLPLGDGAVFFCLHREMKKRGRAFVRVPAFSTGDAGEPVFFSGRASAERRAAFPSFDLSPAYGNTPVAMAFDAALAVLAVNGGLAPALKAESVHCISRSRFGNTGGITVSREAS